MPSVAGVDSSTQSTKVELRDLDTGELVGLGRSAHPATVPPRSEQPPDAWWAAMVEATASALQQAAASIEARPEDITAISVAAQQHAMVALDADDMVLRPAKLWNDTESAAESAGLVAALGADRWAATTGSVPVASFTVTKLAWLAAHEPEHAARLARVLLPHDWLTWRLTGRFTTDRGDASGTGYWDPATGAWRPELVELALDLGGDHARRTHEQGAARPADAAAIVAGLPEVLGPTADAGALTAAAAADLGLAAGITVAAGTGDNMAAALGAGLGPGDLAVSLGTSGTVYAVSERPTHDPTGAVAGFADATGRYLPLVCTLNATGVTDTFARLLGVDAGELDALALSEPAGAGGMVLIPHLAGERTPNRPQATGVLAGLRPDASPGQVARAAVEGVVCGLLDGMDALGAAGVPAQAGRLVLVGGGSRSAAYRQVLADLTGRPVEVPAADEHVALGACVQAAAALTGADPLAVVDAWGSGAGSLTEPSIGPDRRRAVRATYAAVRG